MESSILSGLPPSESGTGRESAAAMEAAGKGGGGGGVTLEELRGMMVDFARERDWEQYHSPRNLLLALVGEVGELSEIFQWKGEVARGLPGWGEDEKAHLGEELSDVLLYLVQLADTCGVDLGRAALRKVQLNALKYPVARCKGSSGKCAALARPNSGGSDCGTSTTTTNSSGDEEEEEEAS